MYTNYPQYSKNYPQYFTDNIITEQGDEIQLEVGERFKND